MTMRVLFRVAAGPRIGFGHLRRAVSLAHALGVPPRVSVRGGAAAVAVARRLGCRVLTGGPARLAAAERPHLIVIDDPRRRAGAPWVRAARRAGALAAGVADAGIGCLDADIVIDGSAATASSHTGASLKGPRFAILDPRTLEASAARRSSTVLIALGGGSRRGLADATAAELLRRHPAVRVRIAAGFTAAAAVDRRSVAPAPSPRLVYVPPQPSLARELAACGVAIVGGGVTLYEACALGTASVALAVVDAQRPAIEACAARRAVLDGGTANPRRAAALALALLASPARRGRLSRTARRLVDGLGARRVARVLSASMEGARHAA